MRAIQLVGDPGVETCGFVFAGIVDDIPAAFALAIAIQAIFDLLRAFNMPWSLGQAVDIFAFGFAIMQAIAHPQAVTLALAELAALDHRAIVPGPAIDHRWPFFSARVLLRRRFPRDLVQAVVG